jgi:tellurite resistance protein
MIQAEIMAAYMDEREDELLDAVVTATALVTSADGCIEPVERSQLLDFLKAAIDSLGRLAGRSTARLVVDAGEHVAAADGDLHPREPQVPQFIRIALTPRFRPSAPSTS